MKIPDYLSDNGTAAMLNLRSLVEASIPLFCHVAYLNAGNTADPEQIRAVDNLLRRMRIGVMDFYGMLVELSEEDGSDTAMMKAFMADKKEWRELLSQAKGENGGQ